MGILLTSSTNCVCIYTHFEYIMSINVKGNVVEDLLKSSHVDKGYAPFFIVTIWEICWTMYHY